MTVRRTLGRILGRTRGHTLVRCYPTQDAARWVSCWVARWVAWLLACMWVLAWGGGVLAAPIARLPVSYLPVSRLVMAGSAPSAPGFAAVQTPALQNSPTQTSPAQDVFDEANDTLTYQYGGLSTVSRVQLRATYQQRLNLVCGSRPLCPALQAYPVLTAELTALNDPHSFIQDPGEFRDFVASATGGSRLQFGVRLAAFEGENRLILEVLPQSASAEAGLQRGDILETLDTQPFQYEALRAAREAGRSIRLGVRRGSKAFQVTLTPRESTTRDLPSLSWLKVPAPGSAPAPATGSVAPKVGLGTPKAATARRVALLRIPTFLSAGEVGQAVHEQVRAAQAGHAAGIIVDLRGNPGGDLSECDTAASAFVPAFARVSQGAQALSRMVVSAGSRFEDGLLLSSIARPTLWQGPLAVLVDGASASCSEFFAYEVQYARQHRLASAVPAPPTLVLGEVTAGVANTATRLFPLPGGGALQLTILHYVKPDNQPYPQHVTPDLAAKTDPFMLSQGKDSMVEAALRALQHSFQ